MTDSNPVKPVFSSLQRERRKWNGFMASQNLEMEVLNLLK